MTFSRGARRRVALSAAWKAARNPWPLLLALAPAVAVWMVGGSLVEGLAAVIGTVALIYVIYPLGVLVRTYWWTAERHLQETRGPTIERYHDFLDAIDHLRGLPHHPSNLTSSFGIDQSVFGSSLRSFHAQLGQWLNAQREMTPDESAVWFRLDTTPGFTDLVNAEAYLNEQENLIRDLIAKQYSAETVYTPNVQVGG
jgi:hypothetical protein